MMSNKLYIKVLLCLFWLALPGFSQTASPKDFVVVIDPGHGGRDPGAVGKRGKEKDINLKVALKLGKLIQNNCKDVNIVYTRSTDVFIALNRRAQIANNAKADLFISIHTNSVAKGKTVRGTETYTLGLHRTNDNLEVAKKENSVILIESDYEQRYAGFNPNSSESYIIFEFLQDKNMEKSVELATNIQKQFKNTAKRIDKGVHQAGFLVLRETTMPSVLVELGYISTPDEEKYLLSEAGTDALAKSIYQAFINYKKGINSDKPSGSLASKPSEEDEPIQETIVEDTKESAPKTKQPSHQATTNDKPIFKIQIMASKQKLAENNKQFKGLKPISYYQEAGLYKYTYGESNDYNKILQMKRQISTKFGSAFIIAFKNGKKMNINQAIEEFKKTRNN